MMKTVAFNKQLKKTASPLKLIHPTRNEKLALNLQDGIRIIQTSDIAFCEADVNYTIIHLLDKSKIVLSKTLKHMNEVLPDHFIRIHQSYLVNLEQTTGVGSQLELSTGVKLPISRSKRNTTIDIIKKKFLFI